ncbi:hypothetical protein B484DRAFT_422918 [Ochromonadaceae sp. CCMP2298]|nr:hypothetical protein B484DRAFT_422918 [Ochromonadaceae sp. CCMP2298]
MSGISSSSSGSATVCVCVAAAVLCVYHITAFPTVAGGDSGELLAESCLLGSAHPPGYPLFTLLAHLAGKVPVPRVVFDFASLTAMVDLNAGVAWRVNHLCCLLGACAAALVTATSQELLGALSVRGMEPLSAVGGLLFAFSPLAWEYALTAEVFALNNCICAALLLTLTQTLRTLHSIHCLHGLRHTKGRTGNSASTPAPASTPASDSAEEAALCARLLRCALLGGLLCGLALSNQHTSLLLVAALVPTVLLGTLLHAPHSLPALLLTSAAGFLVGFSSYLYLPLAALNPTPGSWGDMRDLAGFLKHVLRSEYGTFRLGIIEGSETGLQRIGIYIQHTSAESGHALFPLLLLLLGVLWLLRARGEERMRGKPPLTRSTSTLYRKATKKKNTKESAEAIISAPVSATSAGVGTGAGSKTGAGEGAGAWAAPVYVLLGLWVFYTVLWHCVLSNLPLSAPMPFAVHSRFWMQPNLILYALAGAAAGCVGAAVLSFLSPAGLPPQTQLQTQRKPSAPPLSVTMTQWGAVAAVAAAVVLARLPRADKSGGVALQRYAEATLAALPPSALLLSHTDLDWNPIRYLRSCEGLRPDVTHLSLQLIPYPWFPLRQAPLYPHVRFPSMNFPGVSTDRFSEGNAQVVLRLLAANGFQQEIYIPSQAHGSQSTHSQLAPLLSAHPTFPGGVYLDMQSINEEEIGTAGRWRGYTLISWGTQYRVLGALNMSQIAHLHSHSLFHLNALQAHFPPVNAHFMRSFGPGSWERASANVFHDAHYQFGLSLLTFCIELQQNLELARLPMLLDRMLVAAQTLRDTLQAVDAYGTFSGSLLDLQKNTALACMRLSALLDITAQFQGDLGRLLDDPTEAQQLLDPAGVRRLLRSDERDSVKATAAKNIAAFVSKQPQDHDAPAFQAFLARQ